MEMKFKNKILSSLLVFVVVICSVMLTACSSNEPSKILFIVGDKVYATVKTDGFETIEMPHKPTRSGYIFDGWYTDDGEWTDLFTKDYYSKIELSKDVTIYSKWVLETYTITYENLNGATNPNPTTYTIESDNIDLVDISLQGYTFLGWYSGSFEVTQIAKGSTGDFVVTAKWVEN